MHRALALALAAAACARPTPLAGPGAARAASPALAPLGGPRAGACRTLAADPAAGADGFARVLEYRAGRDTLRRVRVARGRAGRPRALFADAQVVRGGALAGLEEAVSARFDSAGAVRGGDRARWRRGEPLDHAPHGPTPLAAPDTAAVAQLAAAVSDRCRG